LFETFLSLIDTTLRNVFRLLAAGCWEPNAFQHALQQTPSTSENERTSADHSRIEKPYVKDRVAVRVVISATVQRLSLSSDQRRRESLGKRMRDLGKLRLRSVSRYRSRCITIHASRDASETL